MNERSMETTRRLRALYNKEVDAYFDNPTAYIIAVVFLLITGYFFGQSIFLYNQADLRPFLDLAPLLLVFLMPAITMRLFAEEAKSGTLELLMTLPIEEWELIAAKFLAAVTLMAFTLLLTLTYPAIMGCLGRVDPGGILGAYIGLLGTGALLASVGIFASSLTRNQVVAFIIAFLICFAVYTLGKVGQFVPLALSTLTDFLGLDSHLNNLSRGVFDSQDFIYYITGTAAFLYLAQVRLMLRRAD